jgi:two-component system chemotaxis sensor kinase CheA
MDELIKEFLDESFFMLDECEEAFLKLDDESNRKEELARIFRVAHTIKGTSGSIGLTSLATFAHTVEDCLDVLRNNPSLLRPEITSLLLKANDQFRTYMKHLKAGTEDSWNVDSLTQEIAEVAKALHAKQGKESTDEPAAEPVPRQEASLDHWPEKWPQTSPEYSKEMTEEKPAPVPSPAQRAEADARPSNKASGNVIKVDATRLDSMVDLIGELVVIKSQVLQVFDNCSTAHSEMESLLSLLDKTVRELQDKSLQMRMTSIKPVFLKLQRTIRDLSVQLGKPVDIQIHGEDMEIDRSMIELLGDPLMHMVRNSLDHGIESTQSRMEKGKSEKGVITLSARHSSGRILIEISDDGDGIRREKVLRRAMERNLIPRGINPEQMPDEEVFQLLFAPGFSTAEKVTEISGRGVGLDVVKSNVTKLRGSIEIHSRPGNGTTFVISLPLTTAITDGIVVMVDGQHVIMPLAGIREIAQISECRFVDVDTTNRAVMLRGELFPLVNLRAELQLRTRGEDAWKIDRGGMIVVVDTITDSFAIMVDAVLGQSQVVIKSLGQNLTESNGLAGAAILGDGKVGLVVDFDGIAVMARASIEQIHSRAVRGAKELAYA